jgi:hypothetical protein
MIEVYVYLASWGGQSQEEALSQNVRPLSAYHDTMVGDGSSGSGGEEGFTGRAVIGYDHGYDGQLFYLGLAFEERYIEAWVEGCLERIGEDNPDEELLFRNLWEDETQWDVVLESLKADCEVRRGEASGSLRYIPSEGVCAEGVGRSIQSVNPNVEEHPLPRTPRVNKGKGRGRSVNAPALPVHRC